MPLSQVPADLLKQVPPGATPVDAIASGNGGYWILGSDGGVFAVGGAPFLGAYTTLDPVHRQGTRSFTHLLDTGGGYSLVSNKGELYRFAPEAVPEAPVTPAPATEIEEGGKESARVWLRGELDKVGLGELADKYLDRFNELGGTEGAANAVLIEMRSDPVYQRKFPGMKLRAEKNLAPISEKEYMEWRDTAKRLMQNAGLPEGFYDHEDDFTQFIAGDVSPTELKSRIEQGYKAVLQAPVEVRDEMRRLFGVDEGMLAAFFLDPDRGETELTNAVVRSQISGAAQIQGFGGLTMGETERLQGFGIGFEQAQQGFGKLAQSGELFESLDRTESEIGRETQLAATFEGQGAAQETVRKRARKRVAAFEGGGAFASGQGGVSGLGQAG